MKVALVLNTSWNIYNFRMGLAKSLQAQGHEVHTIAPVDSFTELLINEGCIHHPVKMDSRGANIIKDSALVFELYSIYKKLAPDVILHYTIKPNVYGTLAAARLKIPTINNVCGLGTVFLKKGLVSWIAKLLYKVSFKYARKVFFQNTDDLNLFINESLVDRKVVDLLPGSGIDLKKFTPLPFHRNNTFTFLLVSRLITDKGVLEYVEAVRALKKEGFNARFQVMGQIDEEHKRGIPKKLVDSWIESDTIEYLGTTEDVRPFLYYADCVVLPSYREGTPRVLLEAASMGKPIIATDVPGCKQVVSHNENGLLCQLKDAADLASKMKQMVSLPNDQLKMFGENGRKKMLDQFDESIVIHKYLQALHEVQNQRTVNAAH